MTDETTPETEATPPTPPVPVKLKSAFDMTHAEYKKHLAEFVTTKTPTVTKPIDKTVDCLKMSTKEYAKYKRENY